MIHPIKENSKCCLLRWGRSHLAPKHTHYSDGVIDVQHFTRLPRQPCPDRTRGSEPPRRSSTRSARSRSGPASPQEIGPVNVEVSSAWGGGGRTTPCSCASLTFEKCAERCEAMYPGIRTSSTPIIRFGQHHRCQPLDLNSAAASPAAKTASGQAKSARREHGEGMGKTPGICEVQHGLDGSRERDGIGDGIPYLTRFCMIQFMIGSRVLRCFCSMFPQYVACPKTYNAMFTRMYRVLVLLDGFVALCWCVSSPIAWFDSIAVPSCEQLWHSLWKILLIKVGPLQRCLRRDAR